MPTGSGPFFPAFGLNTERYSVFSPNARKFGPEKLGIRTLFLKYNTWRIFNFTECQSLILSHIEKKTEVAEEGRV